MKLKDLIHAIRRLGTDDIMKRKYKPCITDYKLYIGYQRIRKLNEKIPQQLLWDFSIIQQKKCYRQNHHLSFLL